MVGWHRRLDGHEFEQIWEMVKDSCAAIHGFAESDMTERLNSHGMGVSAETGQRPWQG